MDFDRHDIHLRFCLSTAPKRVDFYSLIIRYRPKLFDAVDLFLSIVGMIRLYIEHHYQLQVRNGVHAVDQCVDNFGACKILVLDINVIFCLCDAALVRLENGRFAGGYSEFSFR